MNIWHRGLVAGLLAGVFLLGSFPAMAEPYRPNFDQRHLCQGWRGGHLTPGEFRHLQNRQARLRFAEARMRAGGHLNRSERARLHRMENRANRNIYYYRHNNYRPVYYRPVSWRGGWR